MFHSITKYAILLSFMFKAMSIDNVIDFSLIFLNFTDIKAHYRIC